MRVIVPANNKGGVGKTKIAIIIAEYFSKMKNKKVLAIDFDSQCNLSQYFIRMEIDPAIKHGKMPPIHPDYDPLDPEDNGWDGRSSIADIFFGLGAVPYPTYIENLDISPAHAAKLLDADATRPVDQTKLIHTQLKSFILNPDVVNSYDIVVVDTAPSKGPLTIAAIKAATDMIIPSTMEENPIQGVYAMMQLWMQESLSRREDDPLNLIGILPNQYRKSTNLHQDMLESLKDNTGLSKYVLPIELAQRTVYAEVDASSANPKSIFDLPDSNQAKAEVIKFCEILEKRMGL